MEKSFPSQYLQHYYPDANIPGRSAASCRSIFNHISLPLLVVTPRAVLAFSRTLLNIHECDVIYETRCSCHIRLSWWIRQRWGLNSIESPGPFTDWQMDSFYGPVGLQNRGIFFRAVSQIQNILEIMHSIPDSNRTASLYAIIRTCRNHITTLA